MDTTIENPTALVVLRTETERVILSCDGLAIPPGAMWPDPAGAVFGLHYQDWSAWDATNDPAFQGWTSEFAPAAGVEVRP